ncbi:toll-like receptor 13 [Portunus trituberculatus]|uniref:toll-like receptor 13 n=1 Tax=Portunus trituberculatus TaxID=210409 RepID=UPI001E1CCFC9|nr:toll-like receptor 13 [Portunus trituberculatus]
MGTDARRLTPCSGGSVSALLGLLLLAAAATSQAAAIRDPTSPAATQDAPRPAITAASVHHAAPLNSSAHPVPLARDDVSYRQLCITKVRWAPPPPHVDRDLDPLHRYLPPAWSTPTADEGAAPATRVGSSLPDGCHDVGRVGHKTLRCTGAHMTQVPDLSLERNVDSLVFVETGIQVVSDVHHLPRSVRDLTFSRGPLVTFNGLRFYQISGLDSLTLEHNTLSTWSFVTAFYSPDAPKNATIRTLRLQHNLITYPPEPMGSNESVLPLLETLVMSNNPMSNLPGNLFLPLWASNLTTLLLRDCSLSQFYGSPLEPVSGIQVLDLSNNPGLSNEELHELFEPLSQGRLRELYLANNNYVTVPTEALRVVSGGLEKLDLHGAAFQCLDNTSFPLLPRLKELNLMYCRIAAIRPHSFEVFPVLEILHLDGNSLITIPTEILLPTLKVLTMNDNPRSTGDDSVEAFSMDYVDFGHMEKLTNVTFNGVPLGYVEKQYFNDLRGLLDFRLTSCKIKYIEAFSFVNLTRLQRLYINNNELEVLLNDTFAGLVSLTHLDLSGNKITFRATFDISRSPGMPAPTGGKESRALSLLDLPMVAASWVQSGGGERSVHTGRETAVREPHSQLPCLPFEGLSALRHLDLSNNGIRYMTESHWRNLQQLVTLSLMNNNVQEWYYPVFHNLSRLSQLVLSYNSLSLITEAMLEDFSLAGLTVVDLKHNPFQCGCSLASLNGSINTSIFLDFSSYSCSQEGHDLSFEEFISTAVCPSHAQDENVVDKPATGKTEIILISVSILFSVITSVTLYRKRWYLRYLVYKVKMKTDQHKEDADHYLYDIFVCYSQADRQWVFEHLVARLEDGGRYRVCVHERDFTVGQEITENIINSVDRSRKVLVVLSPAFVDSSWCMLELQLASHKILDERRNKLILVLLEALPSHSQPKKLRFLLRSRTYLAWHGDPEGQRLFWVRLQRAVTKPTASEILEFTHM